MLSAVERDLPWEPAGFIRAEQSEISSKKKQRTKTANRQTPASACFSAYAEHTKKKTERTKNHGNEENHVLSSHV
jgi:hypothetical protein